MSDIPDEAVSLTLLLASFYSPVKMSEDPRHTKASNMEFDIPLSQAPPHGFKGDSKTGKEGRFLIENKEDFRHVSPDCRLL